MSERAVRMIERLEHRRPDAVRLAVLASLAVRVDAHLLRRLRTTLAPDADVGAEADLWFSPLVESRGVHGFVLAHDASRLLREMLAADETLLERAHRVTADAHAGAPATIRIEEEVNALALRRSDGALARIDAALRPAVLAMVRDEASGLDIARWAARALPRFHPRVHETESAALLAIGAAARLGSRIETAEGSSALRPTTDVRWVLPASARSEQTIVGVELLADGVRFVEQDRGSPLPLPRTSPLLVHLFWEEDGSEHRRTVEAAVGRTERFGSAVDEVRFRTIAGDEFRLGAVPLRTGIDATLVEIELLGSNGPVATGFIVAPNRIVTAAEPFRGVPVLSVKHGPTSFQARVIHPAEGLEVMRPELEGSAYVSDVLVLEPIDAPALQPALPVEWRLSRTSPSEQNTLIVDTSAEIRWIDERGLALAARGDMGVQHDGTAKFTLAVREAQPSVTPPAPGAPVIVRGMAIGIVTHADSGGILPKGIRSSAQGWSERYGGGYRVHVVGSVVVEKVLEALARAHEQAAPVQDFRLARVPVLDLRRERREPGISTMLGSRRDRWNVIELRGNADAPGITADIHLHSVNEDEAWPLAFDVEEAAAVIVVIDPREDPDARTVKRTLRSLNLGQETSAIPALVVAADPEFREFGEMIGRDAADFVIVHPRDPHSAEMLEAALGRRIPWQYQPGGSREEFERLRSLLANVEGHTLPPAMPLGEFVKVAGDIRAAHTARIAGARILESGGDGVAVLDEKLFEAVVLEIMQTRGARGFNDPLPVISIEEKRRVVNRIFDEFSVSNDLYYALFDGVVGELQRIGVLAVGRGIDGDWLVYPNQFEPRGPIASGPEIADIALVAQSTTPSIRELLLLALELASSEQYDIRGSYWRTPPRMGIELTDRRDGAPLYLEYEPAGEYRIVLRAAYGSDAEVRRGMTDYVELKLRDIRTDWITIERPDADGESSPSEDL